MRDSCTRLDEGRFARHNPYEVKIALPEAAARYVGSRSAVPRGKDGALCTGVIVLEGVCTVSAGASVQSPIETGCTVCKVAIVKKCGVQTPV